MRIFGAANKGRRQKGNYPAALRVTAPLLPSVAVLVTVLAYLVLVKEVTKVPGGDEASWQQEVMYGDFAVLGGFLTGLLVWLTVALFQSHYTTADYVSRRNYNKLKERLDHLKIRVEEGKRNVAEDVSNDGALESVRRQAVALAECECEAVEEGLKRKGMPVVTGLAYIELWHRVHRAEEALIKIEPLSEVLEGAMRDEARLANANMENSEKLLEQLKKAIAKLEGSETGNSPTVVAKAIAKLPGSGTGNSLSVLANPPDPLQSSKENAQVASEELLKARTMLCEVRYEINNFRDNTWEGLVNLRNSLADTVVLLGLSTYALLALAIFLEAPPKTIIWAVTYFLIGAIAGLFARAQAEWGADTAVDDFGLSKTRLLQIPWLSGLAAVGGVLVTAILDPQKTSAVGLATVFNNRPVLLFVAAVFGITPNLLIKQLDDRADKTKDDLESTQTSQSSEDSQSSDNSSNSSRQRRSFRTRTR